MYTLNLIRKKENILDKIVNILFILSGGNFYLNWVLITNPQSKNPLIRFICFNKKRKMKYMNSPKERIIMGIFLGGVHLIAAIGIGIIGGFWTVGNILVNLYPILVQLYIGYRCIRIIKQRKNINYGSSRDY